MGPEYIPWKLLILCISCLRCFSQPSAGSNEELLLQRNCVKGPYLFEEIEDLMPEGIGMKMLKLTDTLFIAKILNISHIFNHRWLLNEHYTDYDQLFDFAEDPDCRSQHLASLGQNPHIRFVYIEAYNLEEPPPNAYALCEEFRNYGFISQATLQRHSLFRQILGAKESGNASTVIVVPRNYHKNLLDKNGLGLYPDCLGLVSAAFKRQKLLDLQKGHYRFMPPSDKLIVVIYLRWGDRSWQYENILSTGIQNCLNVVKKIFHSKHSVLNNFHEYLVFFVTEPAHQQGSHSSNNTEEFDFVKNFFPPGKVEIRVDHERFLEDLDILTSANIYTVPHGSTFIAFQLSLMSWSSTVAITPWSLVLNWDRLVHYSNQLEDEQDILAWKEFNKLHCCANKLKKINHLCEEVIKSFRHIEGLNRTCEDLQQLKYNG